MVPCQIAPAHRSNVIGSKQRRPWQAGEPQNRGLTAEWRRFLIAVHSWRAPRAAVAAQTVKFFRDVVYEHHQEEERELFPAVLASALAGTEREQVQGIVERLTHERREVEAAFVRLAPALKEPPGAADQASACRCTRPGEALPAASA